MSHDVTAEDHALIDRALTSEGGYLGIGHAGFHLEWEGGSLSGYRCDEMKEACIERGLPVIDNRNVPYGALARIVISGPMVAVGGPAERRHGTRSPTRRLQSSPRLVAPSVPIFTTFLSANSMPRRRRSAAVSPSRLQETQYDQR